MKRDVFQAIADPTRREIIRIIARRPQTMNAVADTFDMSRQAVAKHMRILNDCGLLHMEQKGREKFCNARLEKLGEVTGWIDQFQEAIEEKLSSLDSYLQKIQKDKGHGKRKK